jgi:hypothetical protein
MHAIAVSTGRDSPFCCNEQVMAYMEVATIDISKLDYDKIIEIAKIMGYENDNPSELNIIIKKISKMDQWDISKILFFRNIKYL